MQRLRQSGMTWIVAVSLSFPPNDQRQDFSQKLTMDINLGHMGQKSFGTQHILYSPNGCTELLQGYLWWVYVSKETRKSATLPRWWQERFCGEVTSNTAPYPAPSITDIPPDAYQIKRLITNKDIDHFGHANNQVYVQHCIDCIAEAVQCGYYTVPILSFMKHIQVLYLGESMEGDELTVTTWQFPGDLGKVVCQVRKGDRALAHILVTLSDPQSKL